MSAPLIAVAQLAARLHDPALRIVDARYVLADSDAGHAAYRAGHIPGAQFADLSEDLSGPKSDPRLGRHPLPDPARFGHVLSRLGIAPDSTVVVYDQNDAAMAASRFWFLLQLVGHKRAAVLDGGLDAWLAAGLPLESAVRDVPATQYPVAFDDRLLVSETALKMRLVESGMVLLDARAPERFRGDVEPLDKKAGHIPGALNRPYSQNLAGGKFKPADQLRSEFESLVRGSNDIVLSCGSGVTACHNALALSHAGIDGWRLYAPSWSGWIADDGNPVATGGCGTPVP